MEKNKRAGITFGRSDAAKENEAMPKNFLIVTESKFVQKIVQNYVATEVDAALVTAASSAEEAAVLIDERKWDIIVSAMEIARLDGIGLRDYARKSRLNEHAPFVIMTSTNTPKQRERLAGNHVKYYLMAPFSKDELSRVVKFAINDREKRACARYSIPGATAVLYQRRNEVSARIVNISLNGVLLEMACAGNHAACLEDLSMDFLFPAEFGKARANDVSATLVRLEVVSRREGLGPELVLCARTFLNLPGPAKDVLEKVFEQAGDDMLLSTDIMNEPF